MIELYESLGALPATLRFYGASDYATMAAEKGKREPDFSEHGIFGVDHLGDLWAVDWWFKQCETDEAISAFIRLIGLWKPVKWWNEGGIIDKAIGPAIRDAMRRTRRFVAIESLSQIGDKGMKLQAFHARACAKTVHFPDPRICRWSEHVIESLIKFPAGRHDDAPDVCGLIGRGVDQMVDVRVPSPIPTPQLVPFTAAWIEYDSGREKPKVRFF